jgi:hypothetical protein
MLVVSMKEGSTTLDSYRCTAWVHRNDPDDSGICGKPVRYRVLRDSGEPLHIEVAEYVCGIHVHYWTTAGDVTITEFAKP